MWRRSQEAAADVMAVKTAAVIQKALWNERMLPL
jgi:hypothetical protein